MEKKWVVKGKGLKGYRGSKGDNEVGGGKEDRGVIEDIVSILLESRGLTKEKEITEFLNPPKPETFVKNPELAGLGLSDLARATGVIQETIAKNRPIVIHGDYDVDGLCAAAILWETIYYGLGYRNVRPFIPDRFAEGYGLSAESVEKVQSLIPDGDGGSPLLITVDCGITAHAAIEYAKSLGFEVLVTDHHQKEGAKGTDGTKGSEGTTTLWTDRICGAGIAWVLARSLLKEMSSALADSQFEKAGWGLDLAALATVADVQPLLGPNRSFVKYGLQELNRVGRTGLQALMKGAGLHLESPTSHFSPPTSPIGVYELGWVIGPRLNAVGRLENATDALRLLCTRNSDQAQILARKLSASNQERQRLTLEMLKHAQGGLTVSKLIAVAHESYHEGVIGLVAGRLTREFNRPSVVISQGETVSKGSARSIDGFNIVEVLRECQDLLIDIGGHPMAAGFTVETVRIEELQTRLLAVAEERLSEESLQPAIEIDCELSLEHVNWELWEALQELGPFGSGNLQPKFLVRDIAVLDSATVGRGAQHLKLKLMSSKGAAFSAIGFGLGFWGEKLKPGDQIDLVCSLQENLFNGRRSLELQVEDLRLGE